MDRLVDFFALVVVWLYFSIKINPLMIASIVRVITPRSVLLSTKTRKAPIPLVNQSKRYHRPNAKAVLKLFFKLIILSSTKCSALANAPSQKISENHPLILFIITARVSGAIVNEVSGLSKLNQNAINTIQIWLGAIGPSEKKNPLLSDQTLG